VPEIAFTADTTAAFLETNSPVLEDALKARLLIMEMTFVDDSVTVDEVGWGGMGFGGVGWGGVGYSAMEAEGAM
jgi:hypothetical protein